MVSYIVHRYLYVLCNLKIDQRSKIAVLSNCRRPAASSSTTDNMVSRFLVTRRVVIERVHCTKHARVSKMSKTTRFYMYFTTRNTKCTYRTPIDPKAIKRVEKATKSNLHCIKLMSRQVSISTVGVRMYSYSYVPTLPTLLRVPIGTYIGTYKRCIVHE